LKKAEISSYLSPEIIEEGNCQVLIDVGTFIKKIYLKCDGEMFGDKDDWVYVKKEVIDIGGRLVRVIQPENLKKYVETVTQFPASRYIITSLLHSLVVVVDSDEGEMAVALMCDPSLEPDWREDKISELMASRNEFAEFVQTKSRSWFHKLVALLQNYPAVAQELGLPDDPSTISLISTIPGYIVLKLRDDHEGFIPGNEPKIDGLSLDLIQELLVKYGFPINSIVQLLDSLVIEGDDNKPEVVTYGDAAVEMMAIQRILENSRDCAVAISTDSVYKAIVFSNESVGGLKSSVNGINYSTARTGFGNLCGVTLLPLLENQENFLGLRTGLNIYELVDEFIQRSFDDELLNNFYPRYHFFACESGDYLCLDSSGKAIDYKVEAEILIENNQVEQYKNLVLSVILGAAFSLRHKSDYVYHQAYRDEKWQGKPADKVIYYGGFLQHSDRGDGKIGGGLTRLIIGSHDSQTQVMMTPLYTATEAALIVEDGGQGELLERYKPITIERATGVFSTQYQNWLKEVKRNVELETLSYTTSGGIQLAKHK